METEEGKPCFHEKRVLEKTAMKWIRMTAVFSVIFCLGCTGYDRHAEADGISYSISHSGRKAFASEVNWTVSDEPFVIRVADRIENAEVVSLGGFFGTGVPSPFQIMPQGELAQLRNHQSQSGAYGLPCEYRLTEGQLVLPSTIEDIKLVGSLGWTGSIDETGVVVFRKPSLSILCDKENRTFSSENGKLYRRDSGEEVLLNKADEKDTDQLPDLSLREKLIGKYVKKMNAQEKEVWEFWEAFDKVWIHINSYMEDSEYMFSAMVLNPEDPSVLSSHEESFTASARIYSDFAMAGQDTESDFPFWKITVTDHSVILTGLNENHEPVMDSGVELEKDNRQPSQFPYLESELARVMEQQEVLYMVPSYSADSLCSGIWSDEQMEVRFFYDSTAAVALKGNGYRVFRGVSRITKEETGSFLLFAFTKNGGTREPWAGRVSLVKEDDHSIHLKRIDGYEAWPFLAAEENERILR